MATKVVRICDVCGKSDETVDTVPFGLDGTNYEVDLCPADSKALRETFEKFTEHARKIGSNRAASARARGGNKPVIRKDAGVSPRAVREWAKSRNIEVNERGRIPEGVIMQFQEAHPEN